MISHIVLSMAKENTHMITHLNLFPLINGNREDIGLMHAYTVYVYSYHRVFSPKHNEYNHIRRIAQI